MLHALDVLYDGSYQVDLVGWLNIREEQTGPQKGKSALTQNSTIRLLSEPTKNSRTTLYLG